MNLFQWVLGPLFGASALFCLVQTMRRRMSRRAGLLWTALWSGACALVFDPLLSSRIAGWFGIGRGADFALYVGVTIGLYVSWMLFLRTRRLEATLTEMVRLRALDQAHLGGQERGSSAPEPPDAA